MRTKHTISNITAREIFDSRGNPTVEVELETKSKIKVTASVPSGASTGEYEAVELRDNDKKRFGGKGVLKAIKNIEKNIAPHLMGMPIFKQKEIDHVMIALDGTPNKGKLGANAILGISLACARAASIAKGVELYEYIHALHKPNGKKLKLPIPSFNVINGGKHADNTIDFQEFMIYPSGIRNFADRMRAGSEIFHSLKSVLKKRKLETSVGDEGGFAPSLQSNKEALDLIVMAINKTKWKAGKDVYIAMDPAASEFFVKNKYVLKGEKNPLELSTNQMIDYWADLIKKYPIVSIEDPLDQNDDAGWQHMTKKLGKKIQIVGDDYLVTNPKRITKAIEKKSANALLVKYNQIGTLTETLEAISHAQKAKWGVMVSHRSGETCDDFIADLVVGTQAGQIKSGSLSRGERLAKYNRLLKIDTLL